eukprot:TRINITY_DN1297_c0_g2_i2.p1 TRINITY_DN1297_c0_g2~~TRINITY_DN1297_c0_g2_i2.p1  ORF type:complete len:100 (+),score=5.48 TRINITY_DN1297_c0_g2_i2:362-661(+)
MFHNTRIFRNLSGCNYSSLEWRKHLCLLLSDQNKYEEEHELKTFTDSFNKRAQWLFCSHKTYKKCTACSIGICDKCFYSSKHLNYVGTDKFKKKRKPIN